MMRLFFLNTILLSLVLSCSPARDYKHSEGLKFDMQDWTKDERLERPFLINRDVNAKLSEGEETLYLPAKLFRNTSIKTVYFEDMKSESVEFIEGGKPRYKVNFTPADKIIDEKPYSLEKDEAVIDISTQGIKRTILIKDIRIPFNEKGYSKP